MLQTSSPKKLAAEQFESAASCLERSFIGPILVSHLFKICGLNPSRAIELCLQRSYHITPLDVLNLSKSSGLHPQPFLEYISRILDCLPDTQKSKVIEKILHLTEIRTEWMNGILQIETSKIDNLKCSCGWPRPGSHLFPWKHSELILHVLSSQDSNDTLFEKCFSCGFWKGCLLLAKLKKRDVHTKLIVHLSDIHLLNSRSQLGYLPSTLEEWTDFFCLYSQSTREKDFVSCLSCENKSSICTEFLESRDDTEPWKVSMQWESIARVALCHLEPFKVLNILRSIQIPNGALSMEFYKTLMMSIILNQQQSALTNNTLSTVGSYLWSRKLQCLSPEIRLIYQKERLSEASTDVKKDCNTTNASGSYLEEGESHWGVKMNLGLVCHVCKFPLTSHLSPANSGVTVFQCGHAYHAACSREEFCIVCLNSCDDG